MSLTDQLKAVKNIKSNLFPEQVNETLLTNLAPQNSEIKEQEKEPIKTEKSDWAYALSELENDQLLKITSVDPIISEFSAKELISSRNNIISGVDPIVDRPQRKQGRPKKRAEDKNKLIRSSLSPWFDLVLTNIMNLKNKKLLRGEKKWGYGRAILFIYRRYQILVGEEEKRLENIAKKIQKLTIRKKQIKDPELLERFGKKTLYRAYLNEMNAFESELKLADLTKSKLQQRLTDPIYKNFEELIWKKVYIKSDLSINN
jgi:hypothetical protein